MQAECIIYWACLLQSGLPDLSQARLPKSRSRLTRLMPLELKGKICIYHTESSLIFQAQKLEQELSIPALVPVNDNKHLPKAKGWGKF